MSLSGSVVYYCCVSNGVKVLYGFNNGDDVEIEKLAALCLEKVPSHHKWYFQTMCKKSFGFLIEDGYVFFAIFDQSVGGVGKLEFLEHFRDEFKKVAKKGSKRSGSGLKLDVVQEKMEPVVRRLIASLDKESNACRETPLLGKSSKQEKRKTRDHVISVRENGAADENRKSGDKGGAKVDSSSIDPDNQGGSVDGIVSKEVSSMSRSTTQTIRNKWCRQEMEAARGSRFEIQIYQGNGS
ncbi:Longin domain-containing protein [Artemisia annua]|uniref:Longin domain-containing protein n=1 Tax=Artemisia annua TaxID=35608 RepID=A0A2U1LBI0_ARTAN|nr:Longin domain-containing protein [Artemisia annua]